jgi:paired amphipathic helix protein Sin3a
MYKCEEERYEFDLNIEANLDTIALLEPWMKKLDAMSIEEKAKFRLPRDLGGFSTSIFQRMIKKIYDRERGLEVIEAVFTNPAIALPIVMKRLKQKDEEWKRSQVSVCLSQYSVTGARYGERLTPKISQSRWIIKEYSSKQLIEKL